MDDKQKKHYLISVDKKQVFLASLAFSFILALFFFLGLTIGKKAFFQVDEKYASADQEFTQVLPGRVRDKEELENKEENDGDGSDFTSKIEGDAVDPRESINKAKNSDLVFENYLNSKKLLQQEKSSENDKISNVINKEESFAKKNLKKNVDLYKRNPVSTADFYFIEVLSTKDLKKAGKIVSEFKEKKYPVIMHTRFVDNGDDGEQQIYLVRIGLYKDNSLAKMHLQEIKSNSIFDNAFIARYRKKNK